ncbi:hypothetical protein LX32DRAFT_171102 [Colletotrichum zoysiae]|uniref:Secreted protein n=1 Tax=Colletotrichum zoysiae TaxID=1216348 RepID=A0AAD9LUU9_9PEZI|nr:hypothetical protein LX32DRAFT_171102 [Colletotrichum zoysiae]
MKDVYPRRGTSICRVFLLLFFMKLTTKRHGVKQPPTVARRAPTCLREKKTTSRRKKSHLDEAFTVLPRVVFLAGQVTVLVLAETEER